MKPIKIGKDCYLVEWRYKDFLKIGHEFQGSVIVSLDRYDHGGGVYVRVIVDKVSYNI
jgi:hypothetical protein